ncbi:hypothetical protein HC891_01735 [Candidatus Gracilibacteria bacterium]|nr:hypothetical protein [Candidatus Gracilibacteria bacterium]
MMDVLGEARTKNLETDRVGTTALPVQLVLPMGVGALATLTHWLRATGDSVALGEPLALAVTERAEYVLPSTAAGVLTISAAIGAILGRVRGLVRSSIKTSVQSTEHSAAPL